MGKWEGEGEGERVSLNRRHLEKAHWLWSWMTGPSYLVSHLFRLYAEIKPFSSSDSSFISPSEMTEPTRPATFCRDTGKLIIASCNFLLACSMATTSCNQIDWQQIHVSFLFSFFFLDQWRTPENHMVQGWRRVFFVVVVVFGFPVLLCEVCLALYLFPMSCLCPFSSAVTVCHTLIGFTRSL